MPRDEIAPDTIAAIATPPGTGGVGVIRVSGPGVPDIARALTGGVPPPRLARLCDFRDGVGDLIDQGLALYFPAPASYTGEHVLELQGHGGPVVVNVVLAAVLDAGARLAGPGEFTRRAFLTGKIDLAQAESVADLIEAASREAARSALRSLRGDFSAAVRALVSGLTDLRVLTESILDFPEEEVDRVHLEDARTRLAEVRKSLDKVLSQSRQGSLLRTGIHVVLAGKPNAGKSSLLNRLAGEERAIVTAVPGTTRDALRESIQIEGVPLVVVDTAGLRESRDEVERIGMDRARQEIARADLVLAVRSVDDEQPLQEPLPEGIEVLEVINKIDLSSRPEPGRRGREIRVSAKTGSGMEVLREAILDAAGWQSRGESVFLARERHLRALAEASRHLEAAAAIEHEWEFFAEELRQAQEALGTINGRVSADELLGEIFSRFCIGK